MVFRREHESERIRYEAVHGRFLAEDAVHIRILGRTADAPAVAGKMMKMGRVDGNLHRIALLRPSCGYQPEAGCPAPGRYDDGIGRHVAVPLDAAFSNDGNIDDALIFLGQVAHEPRHQSQQEGHQEQDQVPPAVSAACPRV